MNIYFFSYPKQEILSLVGVWPSIREILTYDINSKYKHIDNSLSDQYIFQILQTDSAMEAVFYYRLERHMFLREPQNPVLPFLASLMRQKTGIELYYSSEIGPGLNIQHGMGIVIGPRYKIGSNFTIHQGVTLGQKRTYLPHEKDLCLSNEKIIIGNNVSIFAGAKVIGKVKIGDNVQIGTNAVVTHDAEENGIYVGVPAKKIGVIC